MAEDITELIAGDAQRLRQEIVSETNAPVEAEKECIDYTTPLHLINSKFLDAYAELEPVQVWCKMGNRDAFPLVGIASMSAKQKQGKSMGIYSLAIPFISGKPFGNIVPYQKAKRMIIFDTEMDRTTLQMRMRSVLRVVGKDNPAFSVYPLAGTPKDERLKALAETVEEYNPDIIVIDVLTDFVLDINSPIEAAALMEEIMKIAATRTVICIIHENKGDENLRGHIGSLLSYKAVENYKVKKAHGIFEMSVKESRITNTDDAESFKFAIDTGGNIISNDTLSAEADERQKAELYKMFEDVFGDSETLSHTTIKNKLIQMGFSDGTAKNKMATAIGVGIIKKTGNDKCAPYVFIPL